MELNPWKGKGGGGGISGIAQQQQKEEKSGVDRGNQ